MATKANTGAFGSSRTMPAIWPDSGTATFTPCMFKLPVQLYSSNDVVRRPIQYLRR